MLLAHPNHLTHGSGGLNAPIGKHDREIVPVGIQDFVRIPFYSLAPYPCHAKPRFTSRCAIKAPSKGELGSPTSDYSNPLTTTTTALAAFIYGFLSVLMYITKPEFGPKRLIPSSAALLLGWRTCNQIAEISNELRTHENSQAYSSFSLFLACLRSRLRPRCALRMSTTQRGTKGQGSGTPTAPVNPMTPITKAAASGTFSTV